MEIHYSLDIIKENTIWSSFTIYIQIIEIPTNKGANSYKFNFSKLGNCIFELLSVCILNKPDLLSLKGMMVD